MGLDVYNRISKVSHKGWESWQKLFMLGRKQRPVRQRKLVYFVTSFVKLAHKIAVFPLVVSTLTLPDRRMEKESRLVFSKTKRGISGSRSVTGLGHHSLVHPQCTEFRPVPTQLAEPCSSPQPLPNNPRPHSLSFGVVTDTTVVVGHDEFNAVDA